MKAYLDSTDTYYSTKHEAKTTPSVKNKATASELKNFLFTSNVYYGIIKKF